MLRIGAGIVPFSLLLFVMVISTPIHAFEITSDPQYVIINLADPKEKHDWDVSQEEWDKTVKPVIIQELDQMRQTLGEGTDDRRLAWSIIVTYNEFPLDEPSQNSSYVTYVQRIMDVAEEEDLPVFIPLNGYQWWNQLPELYNYWDPDGTQTPQCTNDSYGNCPFPELRDPEFRERFIAGTEPMPLNTRDWGGGPFQHAPNPNLVDHPHTPISFVDIQRSRSQQIVRYIVDRVQQWQAEGKEYLFAGISIGTEVSLNATLGPDEPFVPYGYRGIQDQACPPSEPTCLEDESFDQDELNKRRRQVVSQYLADLSRRAVLEGMPKQRIYTHVWAEVQPDDAERYVDYFDAAINPYARPGMSNYVHSHETFSLVNLDRGLSRYGEPAWGVPEFSAKDEVWLQSLQETMANNRNPARIINIYNKREIWDGPAVPAISQFLNQPVEEAICSVSQITQGTNRIVKNPESLTWTMLTPDDDAQTMILELYRYAIPEKDSKPDRQITLTPDQSEIAIPLDELETGVYHWIIRRSGCRDRVETTTTPGMILVHQPPQLSQWEKWLLSLPDLPNLQPWRQI